MLAHRLYDRQGNYKGSFGAATKEALYDITAHPIDQSIYSLDKSWHEIFKEGATSYITDGARNYRRDRDMNMDIKNPREELPKDKSSILAMDVIPNLIEQKVDISHPADYEASTNARLFQMSELNSKAQESLFTDPQAMENPALVQEGNRAKPTAGLSQDELYSMDGSAVGKPSNYLYTDQDGSYLWSVENMSAF